MYGCNVSISDENGILQFYSNCKTVANYLHQPMPNGSGLNPGDLSDLEGTDYSLIPQGIVALPVPDKSGRYYLIHSGVNIFPDASDIYGFSLF
jgi:hypothetical protein